MHENDRSADLPCDITGLLIPDGLDEAVRLYGKLKMDQLTIVRQSSGLPDEVIHSVSLVELLGADHPWNTGRIPAEI